MSHAKRDISAKEESISDMLQKTENKLQDRHEQNLGKALKKSLSTPLTRVILRLIPVILLISSIAIFVTGIMRFGELEREQKVLEKRVEAYDYEIEELRYLLDSPVDFDYIVRVAREKLGLHLPDEIVYYSDINE